MNRDEHRIQAVTDHIGNRTSGALVRHMRDIDPGIELEQLHGQVLRRAVARGAVVQFTRLAARQRYELLCGFHRRIHAHQQGHDAGGHQTHRHETFLGVETQTFVDRRIGHQAGGGHQQRVTIGRRACHELGADVAAGTGLVVDHHSDAPLLREALRQGARDDVDASAGRERHHQGHRAIGVAVGTARYALGKRRLRQARAA